ncbi:MAG: division plane positioning ATPase MipZ [Alphaproteobacteria bacterium]
MSEILSSPTPPTTATRQGTTGRVLVVGNEKGGSGKSTAAIHLAVGFLQKGIPVATVDIDYPQGTFTRYMENRIAHIERTGKNLIVPEHHVIPPSTHTTATDMEQDERQRYTAVIDELKQRFPLIIVDTPGSVTFMSRLAHGRADVILTPLNDSFIDLDVVAQVDLVNFSSLTPSHYANMVMQARARNMRQGKKPVEWIVMRNRLSPIASHNKVQMAKILELLGRRFGFRSIAGFSERVAFRELFLQGLTLLDATGSKKSSSYLAAKTEVDNLLAIFESVPATTHSSA